MSDKAIKCLEGAGVQGKESAGIEEGDVVERVHLDRGSCERPQNKGKEGNERGSEDISREKWKNCDCTTWGLVFHLKTTVSH